MEPIKAVVDDVEETGLGYHVEVLLPTTQILSTTTDKSLQIGDVVWVTIDFERKAINKLWTLDDMVEKVPEPGNAELGYIFEPVDILDLPDDPTEE